jgi:hypothetical protein
MNCEATKSCSDIAIGTGKTGSRHPEQCARRTSRSARCSHDADVPSRSRSWAR